MGDVLPRQGEANVANAIRVLAMDAVQNAQSGHPGMPMGMAEIAAALWLDHLRFNPEDPNWPDRDRVVLSNGHGSMLLYGVLHLTGYDLTTDDLRNFRQLDSRTPGHPERGDTPGVETTTGPLGQGFANAVGMAMAERNLAGQFNRPGHTVVDHYTYVLIGDGCLMEGISHEAASLAGALGLGKLIALYDDNLISIDGPVSGWWADDTPSRFRSYGWQVIEVSDGHDRSTVSDAIAKAKAEADRPTLICCRTEIGRGAPSKAGKAESHGAPLGVDEIEAAKQAMGWSAAAFEIPADVAALWDRREAGRNLQDDWERRFAQYETTYPELTAEFERRMAGTLPATFDQTSRDMLAATLSAEEGTASRKASQSLIAGYTDLLPELIGGAADLTDSTSTRVKAQRPMTNGGAGDFVYYGVREFGMAAVMNGMAAHGGFRPYGGTYLVFSDYARNALRMAALMKLGVIYVLTHDSIALGQDGPTHQPVEHLAALRLVPGLDLWRPCDSAETAVAWEQALKNANKPTALVLSRQELPFQPRSASAVTNIARGGYVLRPESYRTDVVLMATGSEVAIAMDAADRLAADGVDARVVSMPSTHAFDAQSVAYRDAVLPPSVPRVAVEAAASDYWRKYVGLEGAVIGLDQFGASAPPEALFEHFDITVDAVVRATGQIVSDKRVAS